MDEFRDAQESRCATVVAEPPRKSVLWAGEGCNREDILPIFQMLGRGKTWTQIYESRDSGRSQSIIALRAH
jgi:hypothetical protein